MENEAKNGRYSLDTVCAALAYAMGVEPPQYAAEKNPVLSEYIDSVFGGEKADRILMYHPGAIARWIYEKYRWFMTDATLHAEAEVPLEAVMPSVTPVCFGTMYTGAQPEIHGIQNYEKPVIRIDTLFDALLRAGKKVALITYGACSLGKIYLEREMDYFHFDFEQGGEAAVNAKAAELILRDEHDFILIYNGNYDSVMHKFGPESPEALGELRANCHIFGCLSNLIRENWKHHNALAGFAMDHGCHEIDGGCGSHGLAMKEDLQITHLYKGYKREV
ncbi:MAG: alkaline phosphatase family protein [Clostridia bacterium]|nr:alkaline phosphatase family protein [Clostridia bacterium]